MDATCLDQIPQLIGANPLRAANGDEKTVFRRRAQERVFRHTEDLGGFRYGQERLHDAGF